MTEEQLRVLPKEDREKLEKKWKRYSKKHLPKDGFTHLFLQKLQRKFVSEQ